MKLNASSNCLHDVLAQHIEELLPSVTGPGLPCDCGPECGAGAVVSRGVVLCVAVLLMTKTRRWEWSGIEAGVRSSWYSEECDGTCSCLRLLYCKLPNTGGGNSLYSLAAYQISKALRIKWPAGIGKVCHLATVISFDSLHSLAAYQISKDLRIKHPPGIGKVLSPLPQ